MKKINLIFPLLSLLLTTFNADAKRGKLFKTQPGVVSYTYRNYFEKDVPSTLDMIKRAGFKDIEFSNLLGTTAAELRRLLDERGLKCSSFGVSYNDLLNKTQLVAEDAKTLGADFVRVASIPHKGAMTLVEMQTAIEFFNTVGKILKEQFGLTFIYHNHGFEFQPYNQGTLYDYLVTQTNPKFVSFELDILWAFFPGYNPAELLKKYGKRYKTLHLKDLKKGVKGNLSGTTPKENDVALGTGQIDIAAVLKAAKKAKIRHYYIEDESDNVLKQVPESIKYLRSLSE